MAAVNRKIALTRRTDPGRRIGETLGCGARRVYDRSIRFVASVRAQLESQASYYG